MILKTLTHDRGTLDCWNYYSGVRNASVFFNEELNMTCVAITGNCFEGEVIVRITGPTYLCTDNGQTIEKLHPFRKEDNYKNLNVDDVVV